MTAQPSPPPLFSERPPASGLGYHGAPTRPFYWSVWRELWENRSLYIAPLIVAAVQLFGFADQHHWPAGAPARRCCYSNRQNSELRIEAPYDIAAMMMIFTVFIVGVFYCLDALHGERRDRSILFWKSLPVSDLTTVLSKVTDSAGDSAAGQLRDYRWHAIDHGPDDQRNLGRPWDESGIDLDRLSVVRELAGTVLRSDRRLRSGMRRSTAGRCWSPAGRGARHFCGLSCRLSRSRSSRRLLSTHRISPPS